MSIRDPVCNSNGRAVIKPLSSKVEASGKQLHLLYTTLLPHYNLSIIINTLHRRRSLLCGPVFHTSYTTSPHVSTPDLML